MHLVAAPLQPSKEAADAIPDALSGVRIPLAFAFQHPGAVGLGQIAPWHIGWYTAAVCKADQVLLYLGIAVRLDRLHRAIEQRLALVRHHQRPVDADGAPEAAACLAGAHRRIEREQVRRRLAVMDIAVRAVQVGGEKPGRAGLALGIERIHTKPAVALAQSGLQRLDRAALVLAGQRQPVLDHLDLLVGLGLQADVALLREQLLQLSGRHRFRHRYVETDQHPRRAIRRASTGSVPQRTPDALRRVAPDLAPAAMAEQPRGAREQQLQMVIQLRHGADRRARGAHRVGLINGDGRRNAIDPLCPRPVHAIQKLPRIGREGLDIAALSLRIHGIEGQRRLARAGHAGDHDQLAQRQIQVEVFQIVLPHPAQADAVVGVGHLGRGPEGWCEKSLNTAKWTGAAKFANLLASRAGWPKASSSGHHPDRRRLSSCRVRRIQRESFGILTAVRQAAHPTRSPFLFAKDAQ